MPDNASILQMIQTLINDHQVVLFMKGTADQPACGFSSLVVQELQHLIIEFKVINVLEGDLLRQGIKDFTTWPTVPQLYIRGEFIGGADIIKSLWQQGEFFKILDQKQVAYTKPD